MAFAIWLLTTFMAGGRQSDKLTHMSSATKSSGISDFGAIDHRRHQPDAMFPSQFINDRFVSGLLGQPVDGFLNPFDLHCPTHPTRSALPATDDAEQSTRLRYRSVFQDRVVSPASESAFSPAFVFPPRLLARELTHDRPASADRAPKPWVTDFLRARVRVASPPHPRRLGRRFYAVVAPPIFPSSSVPKPHIRSLVLPPHRAG